MRLLFIFIFSSFVILTHSQNEQNRGYKIKIGDQIPEFSVYMLDGSQLTSKDLLGKITVIQFTGSWCSVCRREMPELEKKVWQEFQNQDFLLLGIDTKEPIEKVTPFIKKMEVTYPIALDPEGKIFSKFTVEGAGVTRNIVIDKNGKVVFLTRLFEKEEFNAMVDTIKQLLSN
jgi:peroxiredoxin